MAAMKARTRAGSVTLLDPQPPVARMLDLLCIDEMFSIRDRAAGKTHSDISTDGGWRPAKGADHPVVRVIPGLFSAERAGPHA